MSDLVPGDLLHKRYRILRTLGKGGMGMVYLAEDGTLKRQVAIKANFSVGEDSADQFLQEAHLLASLHHANLPRVTDYFIESPFQYLVMDYLPGDDLQTLLEREGRQPLERMLIWMEQLVDALQYMHNQTPPVIHRDIKPANIKLRKDDSAALVDFGIAKAAETAQKTAAGAMGFTPGFAPPEQSGGGRTGPFSDQYALAATLYTMLTGTRPVDSVKRVLEGATIPPARELLPGLSENVSDALKKALELRPEDRFDSVHSFMDALKVPSFRWLGPITRSEPEKRPAWFYPAMGLIVFLVIAILGVSTVAYFRLAKPVKPTEVGNFAAIRTKEGVSSTTASVIFPSITETQPSIVTAVPTRPTASPESTMALLASGKWLAFTSNRGDGKTREIWLTQIELNQDGKPAPAVTRQLTNNSGDKFRPAWSPDGKYLLYSAPAASGNKADGLDIWKISVNGGDPVDLTNRKGDELYPCWSPKGDLISFTSNSREDGILQLYSMDSTGNQQTRISSDFEEQQGIWPPDMQVLFYVIHANDYHYFFQRASAKDYMTPQPYDTNQIFGRLGQVSDPDFSKDGSLLAYTRSKGRDQRIGVAEYAARGAVSSLITTTGKDYDPSWSADDRWIAFTSERDGKPQIYIMNAAGLLQSDISPLTAQDSDPAWQP